MRKALWVAGTSAVLIFTASPPGLASTCEIEIEQPLTGRGFFFSVDTPRWQEFVPSRSTVCEVRLPIRADKLGGDLVLRVEDDLGVTLGQATIVEAEVVLGDADYRFEFLAPVSLDEPHRLVLSSSDPDVFPAAYFWMGDEASTYADGISDIHLGGLPGFDYAFALSTVTSSAAPELSRPFTLRDPVPNPFNPSTEIAFELARDLRVCLSVYDVSGRWITTLSDRRWGPGTHVVAWNGEDVGGSRRASGVYLFRLEGGGFAQTQRGVLLK